jgi:hypothetical protein
MKTRKNFWASVMIAAIWVVVLILQETMRYHYDAPLVLIGVVLTAFFMTYQILRILQYIPDVLEKQTPPSRVGRDPADDWLATLSEEDLEQLRARLADHEADEVDSLEHLLAGNSGKRKNR